MTRRRSVSDEKGTLAARIATTMTIIATTNEIPSTHHRRLIATSRLKEHNLCRQREARGLR